MFYLIYNLLSIVLLFPVMVYHLYRSVSRGRAPAFAQRFGLVSGKERAAICNRPVIWLHAVSVGESIAARPLLKALRKRYPDHAIAVSNTTETGRGIASAFPEKDLCIYFPFDFLPAVRLSLDTIKPCLIIIMETEIWPNFTREASLRNIPVILANGRISDRSFKRYLQFSWFFGPALRCFSKLCMQTDIDRERIIAIGAPLDRAVVAGNLKYDIPFGWVTDDEKNALRKRYAIPDNLTVICAGSTHPGEEEYVLKAYRGLLTCTSSKLLLVLAPRHPERGDNVAGLLEREGLPYRRYSTIHGRDTELFCAGDVLLVDVVGELMGVYASSDVVFVGGSLVPTGGHNLLEPASLGVASVFGPYTTNFREITALVLQYGAGIRIDNPDELSETFQALISSTELRKVLGQNGLKMMRDQGGSTERHMNIIDSYLKGSTDRVGSAQENEKDMHAAIKPSGCQ
ncbi:MAG: 3-deoxy-D-manno-octulosonic acid transferase [Geobacteraceae bacterium]|nr:3-deoxy-D-manno-octulosonic acid transferase [Geobacteraceae bacterium]